MVDKFIPFLEAVRTHSSKSSGFQTISCPAPSVPPPAPTHLHPHVPAEPRVTLVRDGERITEIKIQCACGQTIELVVP